MKTNIQPALPLVSVVMPAYNAEAFIEEAIASVQAQTVEAWELIVVDDRSTDKTVQVVEKLSQKDPRIRLIVNSSNLGAAGTRNHGISVANGEYIALLDSDDYWKPELLEKLLHRATETAADITYCSYEIVDEAGKKICSDFIVPEETELDSMLIRCVISCSTVLLRGEIAKSNPFPTDLYHEDLALWLKLLRNGAIARGVPRVLAAYRQRTQSKSGNKLISAYRRWPIYRKWMKIPFFKSLWLMIQYAGYGIIKYKRK